MNPLRRYATIASIALIGIVLAGCTPTSPRVSQQAASATVETTATAAAVTTPPVAASVEDSSAVAMPGITPAPAPIPSQPAPPPTPPTSRKPKLGPKDASVSWAYLKDMYRKDGYWYVVVDYIQVVGPEETLHFVNENPKLRTFPLSDGAKLQLLKSPGSPDYKSVSAEKFKAFQGKPGNEVVQVTPKNGYAIKLKQWWAP